VARLDDSVSDGLSDSRPEDTVRISVRLDAERAAKLRRLASRTGESTSEIVKRAIDSFYERAEPAERPYDVLMRSGFIGCGEGHPDFSTDKEGLFEPLGAEHGDR